MDPGSSAAYLKFIKFRKKEKKDNINLDLNGSIWVRFLYEQGPSTN